VNTPLEEGKSLNRGHEKRLFWLTAIVAATQLLVLTAVSIVLWRFNGNPTIMFVPAAILEWSFAGAVVSVLYRLGLCGMRWNWIGGLKASQ
jgi:hypothetical protein